MEERTGRSEEIELFFNNQDSLHDMIALHVRRLKPASVFLTTFSLSEIAIRSFIELFEEGDLLALTIVTDHTVRKNKLDMLLFANENASIFLTDVHAKIAHIYNEQEAVIILSTSNLNAIKRYEAGALFYDPAHIEFFKRKITELIADSIPFEPNEP